MRRVILESPYAGDVEANVAYARACLRDCLERGEAPIASHLLYIQPGVLDDDNPEERALGIAAGLAWSDTFVCEGAVFYTDRGWSKGMLAAKAHHVENGTPIEERALPGYDPTPMVDCDGDPRGWIRHLGGVDIPARAKNAPRLLDIVYGPTHPDCPGWTHRRFRPENVLWEHVSHWRVCQLG